MRIPTPNDFAALNHWGLVENPLAAIEEYEEEKEELRWKNDRNQRLHNEYMERRSDWSGEGFQEHYRSMNRPIDRVKWEFLKKRKSWYICPLLWRKFAKPGVTRILDLGCGDGGVTQRVADYTAGCWKQADYDGFPVEIVGVDLSKSRIENAKKLCSSPHPKISFLFETGDSVEEGLQFEENYFDYALATGVLEIMEDDFARRTVDELSRVVTRGIYVEDLLDEYPGGFPRPNLPELFEENGFDLTRHEKAFSEPFAEEGTLDPMDIWPTLLVQLFFVEYPEEESPTDQYENR